jgi:hypothetical protein
MKSKPISRLPICFFGGILLLATLDYSIPQEINLRSSRGPISIIASTKVRFAGGKKSWYLSVNSAGKAHLIVDTFPKPQSREFDVSAAQIRELEAALENEDFFALQADYGEEVVDGSTDTITIGRGSTVRTVSIHFLMNWVQSAPQKLKEPARAVRVFQIVRGWFNDRDAVDLKKYDDVVLEAARRAP